MKKILDRIIDNVCVCVCCVWKKFQWECLSRFEDQIFCLILTPLIFVSPHGTFWYHAICFVFMFCLITFQYLFDWKIHTVAFHLSFRYRCRFPHSLSLYLYLSICLSAPVILTPPFESLADALLHNSPNQQELEKELKNVRGRRNQVLILCVL